MCLLQVFSSVSRAQDKNAEALFFNSEYDLI